MNQLVNEFEEITRWPKKKSDKEYVIQYLSEKFHSEKEYSEKEVNQIVSTKRKVKEVPEEVKKKDFDMLPEDITKGDVLVIGENFNKQNVKVRSKLFKLIREENIDKSRIDLDKPTFLT